MRSVTVEVPATSANLGPGFDCLGLALHLVNRVSMEIAERPEVLIEGEGADTLSRGEDNLIYRSARVLYDSVDSRPPALRIRAQNNIPLARGLGSSSAAIVGGLVAANHLAGSPLGQEDLLGFAAKIEGHPDNVAPALFGGLQVCVVENERITHLSIWVDQELKAVLYVPDLPMSTKEARAVLPEQVPFRDAVFNVSRASLLVGAMAQRQYSYLRTATLDSLHQPPRSKVFPAMPELFQAALDAGALGVVLSGAGSSILALTLTGEEDIGRAMRDRGEALGLSGNVIITRARAEGTRVVEEQ